MQRNQQKPRKSAFQVRIFIPLYFLLRFIFRVWKHFQHRGNLNNDMESKQLIQSSHMEVYPVVSTLYVPRVSDIRFKKYQLVLGSCFTTTWGRGSHTDQSPDNRVTLFSASLPLPKKPTLSWIQRLCREEQRNYICALLIYL